MNYYSYPRTEVINLIPRNCTKILDIGCGSGEFGRILKQQRQIEAWGVEPVDEAAKIAEKHLDHVICGFFDESINFPLNYFDAVIFNDSLEHFQDSYSPLHLAKKLIKPDGYIIASLPNFRYIVNIEHILMDMDFKYTDEGILDKTHLRFFTLKSMQRLFNDVGLDIIDIQGINPHSWKGKKIFLLRLLFNKKIDDMKYLQYVIIAKHR